MTTTHQRISRIEQVAQHYTDAAAFSSIEWLIYQRGSILDAGNVGYACREEKTPVPDTPIYRIYSMTKPIVSAMGLILMEQGRLHLLDPVAKFIPGFKRPDILNTHGIRAPAHGPITVEHLFTHRSGLSYGFMPGCPVGELYRKHNLAEDGSRSLAEYVDILSTLPIAFEPGSRWHYSCSTDVLARIIEIVMNESLDQVLQRYLFEPLGMHETGFFVANNNLSRLMPMHGQSLDEILGDPFSNPPLKRRDCEAAYPSNPVTATARGGHGLFSTAKDYLEFALMTRYGKSRSGRTLISRKMLEFAWHNRLPSNLIPIAVGPFPSPGYGWNLLGRVMVNPGDAIHLTGHGEGGWAGAAGTYYWVDRSEDFVGIVMTQNLGIVSPMRNDMQSAAYQAMD
ncbi:MAG: beta-lactamase family protein [Gammaproteobacteria bacterium]|nr:beta-lactamase family protein [Gammaproteobacteria bacterium]